MAGIAWATFLLHLVSAPGYGYFRDELYYLACADHLDLGYVDHPPLIALVTYSVRMLLGDSLYALRLVPALAAGLTVRVAARLARELGGGRYAQLLAAVAVALAPIYLATFSILSMHALDILFWALLALVAARVLRTGRQGEWLLGGLILGIGLNNKLSVGLLAGGLLAGLAVERRGAHFRRPWLWLGGAVALALICPYLWWQGANNGPTIEFMANVARDRQLAWSPARFLGVQVMQINPLALPIWLGGLVWLLRPGAALQRRFRPLGWAFVGIFLLCLFTRARTHDLAPAFVWPLAAGAVAWEQTFAATRWRWWRRLLPAGLVVSGALIAPLARPLLPVADYTAYAAFLGWGPGTPDRQRTGRLSQFFADMHGWVELTSAVAAAYYNLLPDERARACIVAENYGQAGAIDFFGPAFGLPRAVSGHNSYHLWGPRHCQGEIMLVIGGQRDQWRQLFKEVDEAGRVHCDYCTPRENDNPIWICRGLQVSRGDFWRRIRHFG